MLAFYKALLKNPRSIGAAIPSSKCLANTMANCVPENKNGCVIELGPGTGVVTQALLNKTSKNNLVIIEKSPVFYKSLMKKFPELNMIQGDASNLKNLLPNDTSPIQAIVSSLPLLSIPKVIREKILEQIYENLMPDGVYIQFSYNLFSDKYNHLPSKLKKINSKIVWQNFPPARVSVFKKHS